MNGTSGIGLTGSVKAPKRVKATPTVRAQVPTVETQVSRDQSQLGSTSSDPGLLPKQLLTVESEARPERTSSVPIETAAIAEEESTNWILESANSTPYAGSEHLEHYGQRLPRYPKPIRLGFDDALLDALTTSDVKAGEGKLKDLSSTMSWSLKFKKDAGRVFEEGGYDGLRAEALAFDEAQGSTKKSPLDKVMADPNLIFKSDLPQNRVAEANSLLEQHAKGNENPGIGSKTLGKGVCYLRGRKGTRLFYRQKDDKTEWLAVCDKSTEPRAIAALRKEFDLR